MATNDSIAFTSLGMLILDKVHLPTGQVFEDILGGSGSYATLGARLFSPKERSRHVGYTVRKGYDFPLQTSRLLESWDIDLSTISEPKHLSTRGELHYLDDTLATKSFKYLTPTLFVEPKHLGNTNLLASKCFHFFVDPTEIIEQTAQLLDFRKAAGIKEKPLVVWEPRAYSCTLEHLPAIVNALRVVDVFSPNHHELARIVGMDMPMTLDEAVFENMCAPLQSETSGSFSGAMLVIRAGEMGCFVKTEIQSVWLPAYYSALSHATDDEKKKVVDTTGAGNAFLGAFGISLQQHPGDIISAACAGNVAASFVVEQIGVPTMILSENGKELWNGEEVLARLRSYRNRLDQPYTEG